MAHTPEPLSSAAVAVSQMRCIGCGLQAVQPTRIFRCPQCGDLVEIFFPGWEWGGARPEAAGLKRRWQQRRTSRAPVDESGVWRFRELLPARRDEREVITLREGNTPLYELRHCARDARVDHLYAKHQGMNPTGSFKDTGMTVAISVAREEGFRWVGCASTGNTSASMAAYAARGGLSSVVLIPEGKIAWGKLSQALDYGALTCQLRTDFDGCVRVLNEVVERFPVYLLNSVNPYRLEGQKTAAFELLEQMDWRVPDHVIVPGGNLANSSALGKAFLEMRQLGFIASLPKLSIIQAEGANPLVRSLRETGGKRLVPVQAETLATAIRIGNPASWRKALRVLEATGGKCEQVSESEMATAKAEIGAEGVGCEPASAVTLAGLKKLAQQGFVRRNEVVVLVLTGHLLKDPEYTLKFHRGDLFASGNKKDEALVQTHRRAPVVLEADAGAVLQVLERSDKGES